MLVVSGTRPDTIKLAPVYLALRQNPRVDVRWVVTGQHRSLLRQALDAFGVVPDANLNAQPGGRSLGDVSGRILSGMTRVIDELEPQAVVVQGDTSTTALTSVAAYYAGVKVAHVEAGLRSGRLEAPFPEEANRRMTAVVTSLHLAPTMLGRANLLREGVPDHSILVTGNTVVDALQVLAPTLTAPRWLPRRADGIVVATVHRRESWGQGIAAICRALAHVARRRPAWKVILPYHRNPLVRDQVMEILGGIPNVLLRQPVSYMTMLSLLRAGDLLVTDSGGLQEEAPSFALPTLVTREVTERPEAVQAGFATIVGVDEDTIIREMFSWIDAPTRRDALRGRPNPFGDGRAGERCADAICRLVGVSVDANWSDDSQSVADSH